MLEAPTIYVDLFGYGVNEQEVSWNIFLDFISNDISKDYHAILPTSFKINMELSSLVGYVPRYWF